MIKYWLIFGTKKFSYDTIEQVNAALNAKIPPAQHHEAMVIKGESLAIDTVQRMVTTTTPMTVLEVKD